MESSPNRLLAPVLRDAGFSLREAGRLLGVSHETVRTYAPEGPARGKPPGFGEPAWAVRERAEWARSLRRFAPWDALRKLFRLGQSAPLGAHEKPWTKTAQAVALWNEGKSQREIAITLGTTPGSVQQMIFHARRRGKAVRKAR